MTRRSIGATGASPTFIWVGSYKYPTSVVAAISGQFRPAWYFVGGLPVEPVEPDRRPVLRRRQPLLVEPGPLEQQPELPTARRAGRHPPRRGEEVLRPALPGVRPPAGRIGHLRPPGQRRHPPGALRRQRHRRPRGLAPHLLERDHRGDLRHARAPALRGGLRRPRRLRPRLVTGSRSRQPPAGPVRAADRRATSPSRHLCRGHRRHVGTGRVPRVLVGRRRPARSGSFGGAPNPRVPGHRAQRPHRRDHRHP